MSGPRSTGSRTGGSIGAGFGSYGTRTLLIPSADDNLYALDILTAELQWTFPSGSPIDQAPLVAGEDIYVINQAGNLSQLDPVHRKRPLDHSDPGRTAPGAQRLEDLPPLGQSRPLRRRSRDRPDAGRPGSDLPEGRAEPPRVRPLPGQSLR